MSVKILQRRSKLGPSTYMSMVPNLDPPTNIVTQPSIVESISSMFPHRKHPDLRPLTFLERVKEFIHFKKPNINAADIIPAIQRLKLPLLAAAGVAFVAGVSYLAYKLYQKWSAKKAEETVNKIMADLEHTSPDVLAIEGWREKVRGEVESAVGSGSEETMVEGITKIKTELMEKQKSLGAHVGSGIDLLISKKKKESAHGRGAGAIMPL